MNASCFSSLRASEKTRSSDARKKKRAHLRELAKELRLQPAGALLQRLDVRLCKDRPERLRDLGVFIAGLTAATDAHKVPSAAQEGTQPGQKLVRQTARQKRVRKI